MAKFVFEYEVMTVHRFTVEAEDEDHASELVDALWDELEQPESVIATDVVGARVVEGEEL